MMLRRTVIVAVALAAPIVANAADTPITISATQQEIQALDQLLDQAVKNCGMGCAQAGWVWHMRLQQALSNAAAPPVPAPPPAGAPK